MALVGVRWPTGEPNAMTNRSPCVTSFCSSIVWITRSTSVSVSGSGRQREQPRHHAPVERQLSQVRLVAGEGDDRHAGTRLRDQARRAAALRERDQHARADLARDVAGGVRDRLARGPSRLRRRRRVEPARLGLLDDARHHRTRVVRVLADRRLRREHHRVGALEHRRRDVARLGARRPRRFDHRLQHLGGDDHRRLLQPAAPDDLLLHDGHRLGRQLDAQVAARHHHRVGRRRPPPRGSRPPPASRSWRRSASAARPACRPRATPATSSARFTNDSAT